MNNLFDNTMYNQFQNFKFMKKLFPLMFTLLCVFMVACSGNKDDRHHRHHDKKESCGRHCKKDSSCVVTETEVVGVVTDGQDTTLIIGDGVSVN